VSSDLVVVDLGHTRGDFQSRTAEGGKQSCCQRPEYSKRTPVTVLLTATRLIGKETLLLVPNGRFGR
jgi:hypothetical protein